MTENRIPYGRPFILTGPIGRRRATRTNKVIALPSKDGLVTIIKKTLGNSLVQFDIDPKLVMEQGDEYVIYNPPEKFTDCRQYLTPNNYTQILTQLGKPYKSRK